MKLATPPGVKLSILPVAKAAENILAGKYDSQRLFIVARKPDRFLRLIEAGVQLETLNVGNMSQSDETRAITRSINWWTRTWKTSTRSTKRCEDYVSDGAKRHCRRLYEVIKVKKIFRRKLSRYNGGQILLLTLYSAYQICDELTIVSSAGSPVFAGFITGLVMGDLKTGLFIGLLFN